ncbi:hypothetical protein HDF20_28470 [Mucilaginibacter sp. FT3.2]
MGVCKRKRIKRNKVVR